MVRDVTNKEELSKRTRNEPVCSAIHTSEICVWKRIDVYGKARMQATNLLLGRMSCRTGKVCIEDPRIARPIYSWDGGVHFGSMSPNYLLCAKTGGFPWRNMNVGTSRNHYTLKIGHCYNSILYVLAVLVLGYYTVPN